MEDFNMKENKKRNKTAKELAKITGKSRTIRSYFAQDRSSYEEEAKKED
jgi:hypothetical protein